MWMGGEHADSSGLRNVQPAYLEPQPDCVLGDRLDKIPGVKFLSGDGFDMLGPVLQIA